MSISLELKAQGWAVLVGSISLGGTLVLAIPIQTLTQSITPTEGFELPPIADSPEVLTHGHDFFETSCSECHGDDAHGDEGPDLHNLAISNARIATTIKGGITGQMPGFAKKYDHEQIGELVKYLRSLH